MYLKTSLVHGNPKSVLFKFCLPLLGSVIFQQLYNIADGLIAGNFISENALAAVGNSYELTFICISIAFGCNIGCSVIIAQCFGAEKYKELKTSVSTTFISIGILSIILTILGFIFAPQLLELINTPRQIFTDSLTYLYIYIGSIPFIMCYNICTGMFAALGDSKTPFYFLAASSVTNIAADYIFVTCFGLGVSGLAWATFMCHGSCCILALTTVLLKLKKIKTIEKIDIFSWRILKRISAVAIPSILQQGSISIGNIFIQSLVNGFGPSVVAGFTAASKLNAIVTSSFFVSIGNGMTNFTAQNLGAKKTDRIKSAHKGALLMMESVAVIFFTLYFFFGEHAVLIFLKDPTTDALNTGISFLKVLAPFYFILPFKLSSDGVLRGSGCMGYFMSSTFADLTLRVIFAYIFAFVFGLSGTWWAWPIGWIASSSSSFIFYLRGKWKNKNLVS